MLPNMSMLYWIVIIVTDLDALGRNLSKDVQYYSVG